jgi:hypothetical protein
MATEIKRANGKCASCGKFHSVAVDVRNTPNGQPAYYAGPVYMGTVGIEASIGAVMFPCECGKRARIGAVKPSGKASAPHKCGGSCRNAHTSSCDCECGGENHGKSRS